MLLVGAQRDGRFIILAGRSIGIGEEVHVHATDPPGAELDVARTRSRVSHWHLLIPQARHQRPGDGARGTLTGDRRLACELTLRAGRVVWDWNARAGTDYRQLPPTYGVREVDRVIVPR